MAKFKKNQNQNFAGFKANLPLRSRLRSPVFELVRDLHVINTWFNFKIYHVHKEPHR